LQRLSAQQFIEARELLAGVAGDAPKFRDVGARMAETEARMRQQAGEGFKAAAKLEEAGEWSEALAGYERLRPYAASLSGLTEAVERTRKRMHEAGAEALTRARQFDSRGRVPEAIAWYQRAVKWLPPDHPGLGAAKKRLAELVSPA
jgi:tetratricopeptide (TPR) repeat protein